MYWYWIALAYAAYLTLVSFVRPEFTRARLPSLVGVLALGVLSLAPALDPRGAVGGVILPSLILLAGYKVSGLFFVRVDFPIEEGLLALDQRILGRSGILDRFRRAPRWLSEGLELTYLLVYPALPAGAVILAVGGQPRDVDQYWSMVLLAGFLAYGALPWIQTRPPMLLETQPATRQGPIRRLNQFLAAHASIRANTIPSGHAAAAFAAAFAIGAVLPVAGAVFLVLAASLTIASVLGRYHYTLDSALGVFVAVVIWASI